MDNVLIALISILVTWLTLRKKHQQDIELLNMKHRLEMSNKRLDLMFNTAERFEQARTAITQAQTMGLAYLGTNAGSPEQQLIKVQLVQANKGLSDARNIIANCTATLQLLCLVDSHEKMPQVIAGINDLQNSMTALLEGVPPITKETLEERFREAYSNLSSVITSLGKESGFLHLAAKERSEAKKG